MAQVNLNIPEEKLKKVTELAKQLNLNRSAYLRQAIDYYMQKTERELLAKQFSEASKKCRDESLSVCREFENIDHVPE